ncbi:hypothetical protein FJY70_01740 [candidate division WOR-3 bacterium]|nr:hypothetical protein [candidate division WOR-3 bacterium]
MLKRAVLALALVVLAFPAFAYEGTIDGESPWFWSVLVPLPLPTQAGVSYKGIPEPTDIKGNSDTHASGISYFGVLEAGKLYSLNNSVSLQLRPGMYHGYFGADAFLTHRWRFRRPGSRDADAITLSVGPGVYYESYDMAFHDTTVAPVPPPPDWKSKDTVVVRQIDAVLGPALNLGWGWGTDRQWKFEFDVTVGFIGTQQDTTNATNKYKNYKPLRTGILNERVTGIGATIGFWAPLDWGWLFPRP